MPGYLKIIKLGRSRQNLIHLFEEYLVYIQSVHSLQATTLYINGIFGTSSGGNHRRPVVSRIPSNCLQPLE
ncbi:hypothetical protein [aff. Roholtiella sp. LEGE 12411]|uniref:hypothetical protein n=1 Tax=aff. Roholtiella sp. LEGE 12411 TaxID=1828822 RepID=UPI0018809CC7|nr:hypothetical protein [aff. Roholtiella sp. LEGE 12411]MBE9035685.1 hypothetical protein [aff. Roholtiella sp. LEGE 12411]